MLEMRGIRKYFSGVCVLDNIDLRAERGEALGLVGSNGAGKSTLMKVLSGLYPDYQGDIFIDGTPVRIENPVQALKLGIAVIYQEFSLVNTLSVTENIFLGKEPVRHIAGLTFIDRRKLREKAVSLLDGLKFDLDPDSVVRDLGVADQQLVQIAKTMSENPRILVMDEPTARLSRNERDNLFGIIKRFREQGTAVIYISHFLEEVFMVASRVVVLRDGRVKADTPASAVNHSKLVFLMLGHKVEPKRRNERSAVRKPLLSVRNLSMANKFSDITFALNTGEILGVTGLVGAGRTELARAIFGAEKRARISGGVLMSGSEFSPVSPYDAVRRGVVLVPEDRKQQGLVLERPIGDNIAMAVNNRMTNLVFLDHKKRAALIRDMVKRLDIRTSDTRLNASTLSGGNQQKVVLAKWLAADAKVLILDQPTAGIDVGTKYEIYNLLDDLASSGAGIIVISDDPEELSRIADRVLVMRKGRIIKELTESLSSDRILEAITGEAAP
jgi:ribose transport system ATP-binding protein